MHPVFKTDTHTQAQFEKNDFDSCFFTPFSEGVQIILEGSKNRRELCQKICAIN